LIDPKKPCILEVGLQIYKGTSSRQIVPIRNGKQLLPIEIKLGATIDPRSLAGPKQCESDLGVKRGWVVRTATERRMLSPGIEQIPWSALVSGEVALF
jgi:hypothetical protein